MKDIIFKVGTLVIALIALIQPWFIALYKRIFGKGKINIYESGNIEIGYSVWGPTIGINGTLRCVNRDIFVYSMNLEIVKNKDKSKHQFEWGLFRSQKLTLKGEEGEFELPYGFMLITTQPKRYNISFIDTKTREEMNTSMIKLTSEWNTLLSKSIPLGQELRTQKYSNEFSKLSAHTEAFSKIDRLCYWEPSEYDITLKVMTSKPDQTFEKKWKFNLNEEQVKLLRLNVIKILADCCSIPLYPLSTFAYSKYESLV